MINPISTVENYNAITFLKYFNVKCGTYIFDNIILKWVRHSLQSKMSCPIQALFSLVLGCSVSLWTAVSRLEPVTLYDSLTDDEVTMKHME